MLGQPHILAFIQNIGFPEMMVIGIVALLIFGRRLPEVGRSLGRGIVEFKKGLSGIEDEVKDLSASGSGAAPKKLASTPADKPEAREEKSDATT